jgi:hypothetical protein
LAGLIVAAPSSALPPANAERVSLKTTCSGDPNCFNSFDSLLSWMWGTRNPSAANPLAVDIGLGTFLTPSGFAALCAANPPLSRGWVTFRGAGQDRTVISGGPVFAPAIYVLHCTELNFQDLTVRSRTLTGGSAPGTRAGQT